MSVTTNNQVCTDSLKLLGDFWTMIIIDKLSDGPMRFRDLEQAIDGVNTATLTNRLKNMQASHLIERKEVSRADVTYELTLIGKKTVPILTAIKDFSDFIKK